MGSLKNAAARSTHERWRKSKREAALAVVEELLPAARDLVREMGSPEPRRWATPGLRPAPEGSGAPSRAKFCGTWKTLVGFLPMQRPSRKPKTIGKVTAPSTAFSARFRGARPHTPLAPWGARAAQPRGNPIARGGAMGRGRQAKKPPAGRKKYPPKRRPDRPTGPGAAPAPRPAHREPPTRA